jgi:cation diffusion facilitator CzcD-associated flavoprotein CzcO
MSSTLDVVIVGAGLSGIDAAYHLQTRLPHKSFAILEGRGAIGGTWDLFRYPGVRSDSDMFTLGFPFRPWTKQDAIASGGDILAYIRETAAHYGIDQKIRFHSRVVAASWSSAEARWTLDVVNGETGEHTQLAARFVFSCAGYYKYEAGYTPDLPGIGEFGGRVVHPQQWTADIDYQDKRVVVIGSGATAVTLVPALAKDAAHVTMLQRSPTYILSRPARDRVAERVRRWLPPRAAAEVTRWKSVLMGHAFFTFARRFPEQATKLLLAGVKAQTKTQAPAFVAEHFTPSYKPWDQRLCLVPNGDLFRALDSGRAEIVTDHIERFTAGGILLKSGRELAADLVVTATGLQLQALGGVEMTVDGVPVKLPETMTYKGMMCSDVPSFAFAIGYTNASWTLKCDLSSRYVCRVLAYMDKHGYRACTPRRIDARVQEEPVLDFSSGYVQRGIGSFPKQGSIAPWRLHNYPRDFVQLGYSRVDGPEMEFS